MSAVLGDGLDDTVENAGRQSRDDVLGGESVVSLLDDDDVYIALVGEVVLGVGLAGVIMNGSNGTTLGGTSPMNEAGSEKSPL